VATTRAKPSSDQPTFGGPGRERLDVLPGRFFVRVDPGAIRPHVPARTRAAFGPSRMAFTTATAEAVPEGVAEPLEYLRQNSGLTTRRAPVWRWLRPSSPRRTTTSPA
jgi:hypothetical protein